jgi:hypothetical protein
MLTATKDSEYYTLVLPCANSGLLYPCLTIVECHSLVTSVDSKDPNLVHVW